LRELSSRVRVWVSRVWDVRPGEGRVTVVAFIVLLLVISAHTVLETARDALLMAKLPPRALGIVYIAVAVLALPIATVCARAERRFGVHRTFTVTIFIAALSVTGLFILPTTHASVVVIYVVSALLISVLVPQFWTLIARVFTVGQGRRLLGPIAGAGVLGAVVGSSGAAMILLIVPVKALLLVSAATFGAAGLVLAFASTTERPATPIPDRPLDAAATGRLSDPYRMHVAILVALSTATVLANDYFFMWTVARHVPSAEIPAFVARFYAALNGASLVIQLFMEAAIVRRLGLARAIVISPLLLFLGAGGTLLAGGALLLVLALRAIDGSLRYSIHRVTVELLYIPMPEAARVQAKPIIDGPLVRASQALAAGVLLALGSTSLLSPRVFAAFVVALAGAWLAAALTMRRSYLGMLRRVVSPEWRAGSQRPEPINLASAGMLVAYLSSDDPLEVIAAIDALVRRGSLRLIPALILLHQHEGVLLRSLEIFGASSRSDWISLGRRLLDHEKESVRIAAARALAAHSQLDAERLVEDEGTRVQGYAALHLAAREPVADLSKQPKVAAVLRLGGAAGAAARLGLLAGIADSRPDQRLARLLLRLADGAPEDGTGAWTELLAIAAVSQREAKMIPRLILRLVKRAGREAVRAALVRFGDEAQSEVARMLGDPSLGRALRAHLPHTLARFGTRRAGEILLVTIETERDGLVRYKAIRALGRLVAEHHVRVDRVRVERLASANLAEHLRLLGLLVALDEKSEGQREALRHFTTGRLLAGLLDDKARQALERTFRLLKIAHPQEDIRRIHVASVSTDKVARANAAELLSTLLRRGDQAALRDLLGIVMDELTPKERVTRAASVLPATLPRTHDEAIVALLHDADLTVAGVAALHAVSIESRALLSAVAEARRERPEIELAATRFSEEPASAGERAHG
jgi:AAA family ATP:ADP antiporter